MDRRTFLSATTALTGATVVAPLHSFAQTQPVAPAIITRDSMRPQMAQGVQSGDPKADGAMVWTRSDRPAHMWVDWATTASFANPTRVRGPYLMEGSNFTGRLDLASLPAGQEIFYRVVLQDLHNERVLSEPVRGHLRLPAVMGSKTLRDVRFTWSGDTAGQGWGINEAWGGMSIYDQMRKVNPDFFLHSGDTIYADGPISAQVKLPDGTLWNNIVTEEVSKVAETLNDYRGRHRYNLAEHRPQRRFPVLRPSGYRCQNPRHDGHAKRPDRRRAVREDTGPAASLVGALAHFASHDNDEPSQHTAQPDPRARRGLLV